MAFRDLYARFDEDSPRHRGQRRSRSRAPVDMAQSGLILVLWRRKMLVLATIALSLLCGILYLAVAPARYLASTSILIDPRLGKTVGSDPVQPGFIVDSSAIDSQIKLFTSQTVLARVAKM